MTDILDQVVSKQAKEMAVDALGKLVDELHARAREIRLEPAKEVLRQAADLISDKRKEIQRGE